MIALMRSAATTNESTTPESASNAFLSPTCARIFSVCYSINASASVFVVIRSIVSGETFPGLFFSVLFLTCPAISADLFFIDANGFKQSVKGLIA